MVYIAFFESRYCPQPPRPVIQEFRRLDSEGSLCS